MPGTTIVDGSECTVHECTVQFKGADLCKYLEENLQRILIGMHCAHNFGVQTFVSRAWFEIPPELGQS